MPAELCGTVDNTVYSHYSALATLQYNWRLPHLGRFDVGANVFDVVLGLAGAGDAVNREPPSVGRVNNSLSYPGPLAGAASGEHALWPVPNLGLPGVNGQGIAPQGRGRVEVSVPAGVSVPL